MLGDVRLQVIIAVLYYATLPDVSEGCSAFIFRVKEGRRSKRQWKGKERRRKIGGVTDGQTDNSRSSSSSLVYVGMLVRQLVLTAVRVRPILC
jgi:hypothetical protein